MVNDAIRIAFIIGTAIMCTQLRGKERLRGWREENIGQKPVIPGDKLGTTDATNPKQEGRNVTNKYSGL